MKQKIVFGIRIVKIENSCINALVIGAGPFGKNYARILSEINADKTSSIPAIHKLIVTRTRLKQAKNLARSLRQDEKCSVNAVIGAEARNVRQVRELLEQYRPEFIAIAARDPELGDTIHAMYSAVAIKYGVVLCEKPFCRATGDGVSLKYFGPLFQHPNSALFGLELPMAVVARDMMKTAYMRNLLTRATCIDFFWEARGRADRRVMDDLVLHPWSLIPTHFSCKWIDVVDQGHRAKLTLHLINTKTGGLTTCNMKLGAGGSFRGMRIDDAVFSIASKQNLTQLVRLDHPLEEAAGLGKKARHAEILLEVKNPLQQHITEALQRRPIVNLDRAYDSQLFLEALHGYTLPGDRI